MLVSASLWATGYGGSGKCIKIDNLEEENLVFKGGEKLVFEVHYKWGIINADVAKATVSVDTSTLNGNDVFHSQLTGKTSKFFDTFFKIDEDLQSWFTRDGLVPLRFTRRAREGNYVCTNDYTYVYTPGDEHISAENMTSKKGNYSIDLEVDDCTVDLPTMFYVLRNVDVTQLVEGESYPMTFAVDNKVYNLHFIYYGKEKKKVSGLGTVNCLKFGFQVVAGEVFSGDSDLYGWFSDDDNKIPVYFTAPLKIGKVTGRLSKYTNLKHEFISLEK